MVGDSIATGTGDQRALGWPGRIAAVALAGGADLTIYDLGVRGDTSVDVARRWRAETDARLPRLFPGGIVFQYGLNDCTVRTYEDGRTERRVEAEVTLATTRTMLTEAHGLQPTLFIGPAPIDDARPGPQLVPGVVQTTANDDIRALDVQLGSVARDSGVAYLSVFDSLAADERWVRATRAGDGIHPTDEGYEALAELVRRWPAWAALTDGPMMRRDRA